MISNEGGIAVAVKFDTGEKFCFSIMNTATVKVSNCVHAYNITSFFRIYTSLYL